MSGPCAEVIAYTNFMGVPKSMYREIALGQDQGSDAARLIECAGRVCYDSYGKGRDSAAYAAHILESGHGSVLEHASISFHLSGISRGCSHEWVRHRVGTAISQRSTRYVNESESEWCWHPALLEGPHLRLGPALEQSRDLAQRVYRDVVGALEPLVGRKQARGAARGVLGNALATEMVWTANVRALRHIIGLRATEAADGEIRLLANRVFEAAKEVCPEYFGDAVRTECADGIGYAITWSAGG